MPEWMAYSAGAGLGLALLLLFARAPTRVLAENGFLAFAIMVSIYAGAILVSGDNQRILAELVGGSIAVVAARLAIAWKPVFVGPIILAHGAYDFTVGPHTGVVDWYPPLCVGFDVVVGLGLTFLIGRK